MVESVLVIVTDNTSKESNCAAVITVAYLCCFASKEDLTTVIEIDVSKMIVNSLNAFISID